MSAVVNLSQARVETSSWLLEVHGGVLDSSTTARVTGFRTASALQQARRAGRLPFQMFQIPGRRGWFSSTLEIGRWLDSLNRRAESGL